jgi:hypothetical protein
MNLKVTILALPPAQHKPQYIMGCDPCKEDSFTMHIMSEQGMCIGKPPHIQELRGKRQGLNQAIDSLMGVPEKYLGNENRQIMSETRALSFLKRLKNLFLQPKTNIWAPEK